MEHRIFRCGQSDYYTDEVLHAHKTHTPKRLAEIAQAGFNGIWLRGILRNLVPGPLFGRYVRKSQERLRSLETLCRRARKVGLGVWLYCNEPLGIEQDHPFWNRFGHLQGMSVEFPPEFASEKGMQSSLCTSTDEVKAFLEDGFCDLFQKLPLAGVILITASEHMTHCWSHVWPEATFHGLWTKECECKRCAQRDPAQIVTEVINYTHRGITKANPQAKVIAWDWSWNMYCSAPYAKIVNALPKDVILMGDFERGTPVKKAQKNLVIDEYSLGLADPSPRFRGEVSLARPKRAMMAKLQLNTTHELATVPNLPLIPSLYKKFRYLHKKGLIGTMGCWNFGCWPDTLNVFAADRLSKTPFPDSEQAFFDWLAKSYFGSRANVQQASLAWRGFQKAVRTHHPMVTDFLYFSPMNYALAYPLKTHFQGQPMGPDWLKHEWGDCLDNTLGAFTLEEVTAMLGKLSRVWSNALSHYESALKRCLGQRARKELCVARVIGHSFESTYNIYSWYLCRDDKNAEKLRLNIASRELENVSKALPLVAKDPRLGYHQEAQLQMYDPKSIRTKIQQLKKVVQSLGQ